MIDIFNFKIYSQEAAEKLEKAISNAQRKEIKGNGTFEVVATTEGIDRDGEVILVSGWDFTNFMKNPIILWGHNYYEMDAIIGAVTELIQEDARVIVRGVFANTEEGQTARQLYDDGILKTVSVGFIPKERMGNTITKAELLEVSFVSIPANPDAMSLAKLHKMDGMMKTGTPEAAEAAKEEEKKDDETHSMYVITDQDIEKYPELADQGINAGDAVETHTLLDAVRGHANSEKPAQATDEDEAKGIKSGRVLSAKSTELVDKAIEDLTSCIKSLTELKNASEPQKTVVIESTKDALVDAQSMQKMLERVIKNIKETNANI